MNGWKNYETWNVMLWLGNDESLYRIALNFKDYDKLAAYLIENYGAETDDGVAWDDDLIDRDEVNEFLSEIE